LDTPNLKNPAQTDLPSLCRTSVALVALATVNAIICEHGRSLALLIPINADLVFTITMAGFFFPFSKHDPVPLWHEMLGKIRRHNPAAERGHERTKADGPIWDA
jgi:hypothetical protein